MASNRIIRCTNEDGFFLEFTESGFEPFLLAEVEGLYDVKNAVYVSENSMIDGAVYQSEVGATLTTSYSMFLCHFIPHGIKKIILTSTYDVYDKKDNLIRANCKATNTIDVTKIIYLLSSVRRGYKYTINLTVKPTYLYMLSEPDMDNPTMEVE